MMKGTTCSQTSLMWSSRLRHVPSRGISWRQRLTSPTWKHFSILITYDVKKPHGWWGLSFEPQNGLQPYNTYPEFLLGCCPLMMTKERGGGGLYQLKPDLDWYTPALCLFDIPHRRHRGTHVKQVVSCQVSPYVLALGYVFSTGNSILTMLSACQRLIKKTRRHLLWSRPNKERRFSRQVKAEGNFIGDC